MNVKQVKNFFVLILLLSLLAGCQTGGGSQDDNGASGESQKLEVKVPVRDGVELFTRVFLPGNVPGGGLPAILWRTPYGFSEDEQKYEAYGSFFTGRGYVLVVQDIRGRSRSTGDFEVHFAEIESRDAFDTCEWMAQQSWCNGNVGAIGGSYDGFTAAAAAVNNPYVKVVIADDPCIDLPSDYRGNVPLLYHLNYLYLLEHNDWAPSSKMLEIADRLDIENFDKEVLGYEHSDWQTYVKEFGTFSSPYWQTHSLAPYFNQICAPVLLAVIYPPRHYCPYGIWKGVREQGCPENRDNVRLVFTSEGHGYHFARIPGQRTSVNQLMLDYLDKYLKGAGIALEDNGCIMYKTPDESDYHHADNWPFNDGQKTFFLANGGGGLTQGALEPEAGEDNNSSQGWNLDPETMSAVMGQYPEVVFHSEPFEKDTYFAGTAQIHLWLSSTAPDLDVFAYLYIDEGGHQDESVTISLQRLRFKEGLDKEALLRGEPVKVELETENLLTMIERGARLKLVIQNARTIFAENPLTGEPTHAQTKRGTAFVTLYHNKKYPSKIIMPVVSQHSE